MASKRPIKNEVKKRLQLKCVNRRCRDGELLTTAFEMVCEYYGIKHKPGQMVCRTCLNKSLNYYKCVEQIMKEQNCTMKSKIPNFESHLVIDSSSEDESEPQSSSASEINEKKSKCLQAMVKFILNKNKDIINKQLELCDNYIEEQAKWANKFTESIDSSFSYLEKEIVDIKNSLYDPFKAIVTNKSCEDINDTVVNVPASKDKKTMVTIKNSKQKCVQKTVENNTDKDIIAVNHTPCDVPADFPRVGPTVYPPLLEGHAVYAKTGDDPEYWQKCKIESVAVSGYIVVCWGIDGKRLLHPRALAYTPRNPVLYPIGCRVISKYTQDNSSMRVDHFFAGVIAERPSPLNSFRYMIFFDDGRVQYRHHKDIRLIAYKPLEVWSEVKSTDGSYVEFLQRYLEKYPERHMVKLTIEHNVIVRSGEQWMSSKVVEVDASLVRLKFMESEKMEWLYRGSPRLLNIHDKLKGFRMRQSGLEYLNKPFVEFTTTQEEPKKEKIVGKKLQSDSPVNLCLAKNIVPKRLAKCSDKQPITRGTAIENNRVLSKVVKLNLPDNISKPQSYTVHDCNHSCVAWTHYDYSKTRDINVLRIPLHFGFRRYVFRCQSEDNDTRKTSTTPRKEQKCVCYKCPCGRTIKSLKEMLLYLMVTKNKMTIEMFDFNSWVEPLKEFKVMQSITVNADLSDGKEFRPIPCVNSISNQLPPRMEYITSRKPMPGVSVNTDTNFLCGCDCVDDCLDKSKCACWQSTIKNQKIIPIDADQYDPNIGYNYRRLPDRIITGIYECNSTCKCSKSCLNRVVQQPLSQNLQLFMTEKKGWGVRCLNDIPSGSFICIYVGYLLTENDANQGGLNYGDEYLAELDYIEVVEKTKEGYEKTVQFRDNETSDEDYQAPNERVPPRSRGGSKRKVKENSKQKKKNKKYSRHTVLSKARIVSPEPPKSVRDYFGHKENVYIMDAKTSGNIGRYINHSCSPNIFVQNVFVDTHDLRFPWISFFACHFIPAGTELTWDYSYDIGSVPGKVMMCYCESTQCRKRLL